nr:tubulin polyglutamylase TTLL7-like [Pocillopora verrucosa]
MDDFRHNHEHRQFEHGDSIVVSNAFGFCNQLEDSSHGFNESRSVMTKDNLKLLALSTADNFCENQGRESEYAASLADECEENLEQTRSMVRARTNHVRKQTVNNSIKKKPQKKRRVTANLAATKYDVVRKVCLQCGMYIARDDDSNSFLIWSDSSVPVEKIIELKSFQKINHFPSMGEICRKDNLARNMAK